MGRKKQYVTENVAAAVPVAGRAKNAEELPLATQLTN
jgi:hypothetical protein